MAVFEWRKEPLMSTALRLPMVGLDNDITRPISHSTNCHLQTTDKPLARLGKEKQTSRTDSVGTGNRTASIARGRKERKQSTTCSFSRMNPRAFLRATNEPETPSAQEKGVTHSLSDMEVGLHRNRTLHVHVGMYHPAITMMSPRIT